MVFSHILLASVLDNSLQCSDNPECRNCCSIRLFGDYFYPDRFLSFRHGIYEGWSRAVFGGLILCFGSAFLRVRMENERFRCRSVSLLLGLLSTGRSVARYLSSRPSRDVVIGFVGVVAIQG